MPASKYKFLEQESYDHEIGNADDGKTVGTLRVKPSSVLWKPKGAKGRNPWYSVTLDDLVEWAKEKDYKVSR
jgi:hypothetical protein